MSIPATRLLLELDRYRITWRPGYDTGHGDYPKQEAHFWVEAKAHDVLGDGCWRRIWDGESTRGGHSMNGGTLSSLLGELQVFLEAGVIEDRFPEKPQKRRPRSATASRKKGEP